MSTSATVIGITGATWGLTAESGIIVQTFSSKDTREKNAVKDNIGNTVLVSFFDPKQTISINGVIISTSTGVGAAKPGVSLVVANFNTTNGLTTGGVYVDDVDISGAGSEFKKITANATAYGNIS